jgi:hypothetical protein
MTTSTLTFHGRLPGVDCDPALPVGDQPIRLDVAGFVGFAQKGPLDVAVPVEDASQYAAVFGGDLPLAQDGGAPVYAQLPTAVRSFFDNGGRRCYVVRVAGPDAIPGSWLVPGVQIWQANGTVTPAVVESAWPGSWSAGTSIETALSTQQLKVIAYVKRVAPSFGVLSLHHGQTTGIQSGDLIRLDLGPLLPGLYVRVRSVDASTATVLTDLELPYLLDVPAPSSLPAIPPSSAVAAAAVLRFDLLARQHTSTDARLLDRQDDLAFGASVLPQADPRPAWYDVLQLTGGGRPDQSRSMTLRQDAATMEALATGMAVPIGMAQPGSAADIEVDPSGNVGLLQAGDDDLGWFDPAWFVDPALATDTIFSVVGHADQLTVLSHDPVALKGIHALMYVDEVALVAVPDAAQRGWSSVVAPPPPASVEPEPPTPLDWSDFRCCSDVAPTPPLPDPPVTPTAFDGLPLLDRLADFDETPLLDVQVALVTMCAARADQVALLSVPRHYDVPSALSWRARISADGRISDTSGMGSAPLGYAGFWHPWASVVTGQVGNRSVLRDVPPDGTVAGLIAARELARGAWIAPAGTPAQGLVRLADTLTDAEEVQLFNAHANLLVHKPGTFSALSAHTLAGDPAMLQISVRRLLILLRKICLLLGSRYTFEVNNDRFRQLVRMRFDRILAALVDRGALHAFRMVTDGSVNTAEDQDAGRFIVVLQVAPTSPIEFITVTLVRTGQGLLEILEG